MIVLFHPRVKEAMDAPVEPPACSAPFSAEAGGLHYLWRGKGPGERATTVGIYDPLTEQWVLQPTTGPPPPGVFGGGCAAIGSHLYCFGGYNGSSFFNDLHQLNLRSFRWRKLCPRNTPLELPVCKSGCGIVAVGERTLACFGGYGIVPDHEERSGWTNELHLLDVQEGILYL